DDEFQAQMHQALEEPQKIDHLDEETWREFSQRLRYMSGELDDQNTYQQVVERLKEFTSEGASENHLFYLATPPSLFSTIVKQLGEAGLNREEDGHWSRIIIEKPFGRDLESAKALNATVAEVFKESQIYRIDHYLGKDTVQNILVFR